MPHGADSSPAEYGITVVWSGYHVHQWLIWVAAVVLAAAAQAIAQGKGAAQAAAFSDAVVAAGLDKVSTLWSRL